MHDTPPLYIGEHPSAGGIGRPATSARARAGGGGRTLRRRRRGRQRQRERTRVWVRGCDDAHGGRGRAATESRGHGGEREMKVGGEFAIKFKKAIWRGRSVAEPHFSVVTLTITQSRSNAELQSNTNWTNQITLIKGQTLSRLESASNAGQRRVRRVERRAARARRRRQQQRPRARRWGGRFVAGADGG